MALLIPDAGEVALLDYALGTTTPEAQTLKLYESATTPAEGDTAGSYTEATIAGYASVALARATWNGASTSTGTTSKTYPQQTFTFTGSGTIYGYFVIGTTSGTILWSEKLFASGQAFANTDQLKLTLSIELA